ncbi:MAG: RHS repeat-associated core domain-containing protein, partial [Phycisphaerae bacterium]|nr:RHS repeat-associated core domain-containing protein [Phycisphaerae bacterium]
STMRTYAWGLDLVGQRDGRSLAGAAGIGGLLAVHDADDPNDANDPAGDYVFCYDANGNVGQLVDLTDPNWTTSAIVARYAYDPYGNVTQSAGDYAAENPIRFSTKYWDDETGFGYWLRRYYYPIVGRWLNRDPIGEDGGDNLYAFCVNSPGNAIDPLGHETIDVAPGYTATPDPLETWDKTAGLALKCPKKAKGPYKPPLNDAARAIIEFATKMGVCDAANKAATQSDRIKKNGGVNMNNGGTICAVRCRCSSGRSTGLRAHCQGSSKPFQDCPDTGGACNEYCKEKARK